MKLVTAAGAAFSAALILRNCKTLSLVLAKIMSAVINPLKALLRL